MAVRVFVSREFVAESVSEASTKFKSLADAGWRVCVDVVSGDVPAAAEDKPPSPAADFIRTIKRKHHLTSSAIGKLVGVSSPTVCNWKRGAHSPRADLLERLRCLAESGPRGLAEVARDRAPAAPAEAVRQPPRRRRSWTVKRLTQDQVLDIAVRQADGDTTAGLAREYGISRGRVRRITKSLGV